MSRRLVLGVLLAVTVVVGLVVRAEQPKDPRFAAIFDTAKGLVPGQQLKVAGAPVGRIEDVSVVRGSKARVVMSIESRLWPLPADTRCSIRPEGLLSENFVQCDLGRSPARLGGDEPTVSLAKTSVPLSLQDVLNVFSLPTADRLRVLISELGLATAGRGEDLNAILRRANPALEQSRRVLQVVGEHRSVLKSAVTDTDRILTQLARRDDDVRRFVTRAAGVTGRTAEKRESLGLAVKRLPALLRSARPALRSLDVAMAQGTPLLGDLRDAGAPLDRVTKSVRSFMTAATPALEDLGDTATQIRPDVRAVTPMLRRLHGAMPTTRHFGKQFNGFLTNTRDAGGLEGALRLLYSEAVGLAAYDGVSHMQGLYVKPFPQCLGQSNAKGCSSRYDAPGHGTIPPDDPDCGPHSGATWAPPTSCVSQFFPAPAKRRHKAKRPRPARRPARKEAPSSRPAPPQQGPSAPAAGRPQDLLGGVINDLLDLVKPTPRKPAPAAPSTPDVKNLLDFLLGP